MPKRKRVGEAKRRKREAEREEIARYGTAEEIAFRLDPANVLHDALWVPRAACGVRHSGPCCWEPTCCRTPDFS